MMAIMASVFLFVLSVQSAPLAKQSDTLAATSKTFAVPYALAGQSNTDERKQFASLIKEQEVFTECEKRTQEEFARFTEGSISIKAPNLKELLDQSKTKDVTLALKEAKEYQECEQRMRDAFARFTGGSNLIKADELKKLFDQLYNADYVILGNEVLDTIIRNVDTDKSGDVSFYEFAISDKYKKKQ